MNIEEFSSSIKSIESGETMCMLGRRERSNDIREKRKKKSKLKQEEKLKRKKTE